MPFLDLLGRPITLTHESPVFSPPPAPPGFGWACQAIVKRVGPDVVTRPVDLRPGATPVVSGLGGRMVRRRLSGLGVTDPAAPYVGPTIPTANEPGSQVNLVEKYFGVNVTGKPGTEEGMRVITTPSILVAMALGGWIGSRIGVSSGKNFVTSGLVGAAAGALFGGVLGAARAHGF